MTIAYGELGADVALSNPGYAWSTLKTVSILISGSASKLFAAFSASGTWGGAGGYNTYFRFVLDAGTGSERIINGGGAGSMFLTSPEAWAAGTSRVFDIARGEHTVALQWTCDGGDSSIAALTKPDEHAAIFVEEYTTGVPTMPGSGAKVPVLAVLGTDQTANSDGTTFAVLKAGAITTVDASSRLFIMAMATKQNSSTSSTTRWRIKVDGAVVRASRLAKQITYLGNVSMIACVPIVAGPHTVNVEWVSFNANTVCSASSAPTYHGARIFMHEKPA